MLVLECYLATISGSSYDVVCVVDPIQLATIDLSAILHMLRPDGVLWLLQVTVQSDSSTKLAVDNVVSALTLGGYLKPHAEV